MADTLAGAVRDEIAKLLAPLVAAAGQPDGATLLLGAVGHGGELGQDASLRNEIARLAALAEGIAALDDASLASVEGLSRVLDLCRDLMAAVAGTESVLADPALAAQARDLGVELSEVLLALYLRIHRPYLFRLAAALTLIAPAERADPEPPGVEGGTVTRMPWTRDRLRLDRLAALLEDPFGVLGAAYLAGGMQTAADAHLAAGRLFPLLADLAGDADLGWFFDQVSLGPAPVPASPGDDEPVGPDVDDEMLEAPELGPLDLTAFHRDHLPRFGVELPGQDAGEPAASRFGVAVVASSAEHPDAVRGFVLALFGDAGWSEVRGDWRVGLAADGSIPAFVIGPDGLALAPAGTVTAATAALTVERIAGEGAPAFTLGAPDASRLEVGALRVRADVTMSPKRQAVAIAADATSAALVLAADASDGLLGALLPAGGARVPFDLGLVLSSDRGLELRGGAGLDLALAPRLRLGPVTVEALRLALETGGGAVRLRASGALGLRVGPVGVVVEGLGLHVTATFPGAGGSLGPLDLDAGLLAPSGAAVTVDAAVIKGGGFLRFDPAKGEYAGALELSLKVQSGTEIALKAFGLLTTRLPGGAGGWSLLLLIYGEFTPIRLPYGFTLNGVGGVVGIQHGIAVGALREGLRSGVLDDVLFPRDPVADAPRILGRLRTVFPVTPRALTVGPVVRIGWGTPNVMTITLGVLLQFDDASGGGNASVARVTLLGTVLVEFPPAETRPAGTAPVLRLLVDVLGDYDVEQQSLAIDARLRDSKVAGLTLTGSLAIRARFGDAPSFMLAAGGFHPKYADVPPGIPEQDRLGVTAKKGIVELSLAGYFAVTPNTVQVGARATLKAKKSGFSAEGTLGFDALFEFEPVYRFVVDLEFGVTVKWRGRTLAGVTFEGRLEGPGRWVVDGKVSFSVLWWDPTIPIHEEWGEAPAESVPGIDGEALVRAAFADPGNWSAQLPEGGETLVTLAATGSGGTVLAHPLGTLRAEQSVMPLQLEVDRIGRARPFGARRVDVTEIHAGGRSAVPTLHDGHFARSQYLDMTDEEKLDSESFEPLPAGVSLAGGGVLAPAHLTGSLDYETIYLGVEETVVDTTRVRVPLDVLQAQAAAGGSARSALRANRFLEDRPERRLRVAAPAYVAVSSDDLVTVEVSGAAVRGNSSMLLAQRVAAAAPGGVQVVEEFEAEPAGQP